MSRVIVILMVVGLLVGCGGGVELSPELETQAAATVPPSLATEPGVIVAPTVDNPNALPVPADAAIVLRQEGGMEGITEQWTVYQDGRIVDLAGNEWEMPATTVNFLVTSAVVGGFFSLSPG